MSNNASAALPESADRSTVHIDGYADFGIRVFAPADITADPWRSDRPSDPDASDDHLVGSNYFQFGFEVWHGPDRRYAGSDWIVGGRANAWFGFLFVQVIAGGEITAFADAPLGGGVWLSAEAGFAVEAGTAFGGSDGTLWSFPIRFGLRLPLADDVSLLLAGVIRYLTPNSRAYWGGYLSLAIGDEWSEGLTAEYVYDFVRTVPTSKSIFLARLGYWWHL